MRRAGRRVRAELAWMLAGLAALQLAVGVAVDQLWPAVRDPEFALLYARLAARRAEAPDRPLVLALGSSRTQMDLRVGRLNRSGAAGAPLVFNFGVPFGGPMMQQIALRRLLDRGVRPDLVFVEVMPMSLSRRGGAPLEEIQLDAARLDGEEAARLVRYYQRPHHLVAPWAGGRLLPVYRHQAEMRGALNLDDAASGPVGEQANGLDDYGWRAGAPCLSDDERQSNFRSGVAIYENALKDHAPSDGPRRALHDLLKLCRRRAIPVAVVLPPEASPVRALSSGAPAIDGLIRDAARESGARLYDARAWVDDAGFRDPVHLDADGAGRYTERFGREVLAPEMLRASERQRRLALSGAP